MVCYIPVYYVMFVVKQATAYVLRISDWSSDVCSSDLPACRPRLLCADEPTTALDVTIQAGILRLLGSLAAESGMSLVFITHHLAVLSQIATDALVLEHGRGVEAGPLTPLLTAPAILATQAMLHDATATLLQQDTGHWWSDTCTTSVCCRGPSPD